MPLPLTKTFGAPVAVITPPHLATSAFFLERTTIPPPFRFAT